jgi:hypothetical protein
LSIRSAGAWPAGRPDLCSSCCRSLRAAPALLLALQVLRWAALRHLAISCLFLLLPPVARALPGWLPVPVVRVHYDCPSVFPARVLVRRCQARSCLLQNLAPTAAVLRLLHLFWIRLAWPVRWTNTRVLRNTFNLPPKSVAAQWAADPASWPAATASTPASAPATPATRPGLKYTKRSDFHRED